MAPTTLSCKECGQRTRSRRATSASSASARSRSPTTTRGLDAGGGEAQDPGRPAGHLALRRLPAVRRAPARPAAARADAAGARRPARRAARPRRGLDQERRRQPDPLVQGPGRRGRAREGARARLRDRRLRLDRQPRQRGRRPRGGGRARLLRLRPRRPRGAEAARDRRLRHQAGRGHAAATTTSTGSAPSSARTRPWAFVNVNLRPYYAEGSKTIAYETVEQLGWELPDRIVCPIASGSLFTKIGRGFDEWLELGLVEGELPAFNGAQADGCNPVAEAFAAGHDVCRPQRPETIAKSLAIGNPADGPYALELARRTGGSIESVDRRRDPRRDPAARRDDRDLHRDRRRRDHRGAREARRGRRDRAPTSASSS